MTNLSGFDLNLLRVLDALMRERSTVRAGNRLNLSQPAVSAALGRLRHALGDPLFVRQGQGLVPTAFALSLELPLREALDGLESLLRGPVDFDPAAAQMDVCISGSDFFALTLMPTLVQRLEARAPGIRVKLVNLVPDNYIEPLDRYEVDLALIPLGEYPAWTDHRPLFNADFVAIARTGHPALDGIAPGEKLPLDLFCTLDHVLCSPEGRFHGLGDAALARVGRSRRVKVSVPFFEGVLAIVAASDLIALVPGDLVEAPHTRAGLCIYRPPVTVGRPQLCMVWHRRLTRDPAHRWLRDQVAAIFARPGGA